MLKIPVSKNWRFHHFYTENEKEEIGKEGLLLKPGTG